MNIKRFGYIPLLAAMLACNYVTDMFSPAASTPELSIPANCQNIPLATIPPSIALIQPTPVVQANPEISQELQLRVFNDVVAVIDQIYVYPDFNGNDWPAISARHRGKIESGLSTEDFYREIQSMITELGDEHSSFQSPAEVAADEAEMSGGSDFVGVGLFVAPQLDKGQIAILSVFPNSPAERGGLKAHDAILAVDGLPVVENGKSRVFLLRGPECSATVLTVKSPGQEPREVMLVRQRIQSPMLIDARLVPTTDGSKIGYIFIPTFNDETIPGQIEDALNNFGPLDGLILDNRANGGGLSTVLESTLGFFTAGELGQFTSRDTSDPLQISANPIQNSQEVLLVVLVSEETASFGEIFSGVLKDSGRAKIAGQTSLGNVEALSGHDFDDGSRLWLAEFTFVPANSTANWEETGIIPDLELHADWDTFVFETDPVVEAALSLLGHE